MMAVTGRRNFLGVLKSSVNHQPARLASLAVGLKISTLSVGGGTSLRVSASVMRTGGMPVSGGSLAPGAPPRAPLTRHCDLSPQASGWACSSTITSENPRPSVRGYQELL